MAGYESYPADSAAQQAAQQPQQRGPRPASVRHALLGIWAKIALNALGFVIGIVTVDSVVDEAMTSARESGTDPLPSEDTVRTIVLVSLVLVLLIAVGVMSLLAVFVGKGANWARITYTVLVSVGLALGLLGLVSGSMSGTDASPPAINVVLSVLGLILTVFVLVMLWRKDSNAWFSPRRY